VKTEPRVVVLASGAGSLTEAVLKAQDEGQLGAAVVAVVADRPAPVIELARQAGRPAVVVPLKDYPDRIAWDGALTEAVAAWSPDLVASLGFMRVLGPAFLDRFGGRTINSHPSLLPAFPGAHAVADALAAGASQTGCTVHWVDAGVDTGPIISQRRLAIASGETADELHERIKQIERRLVVEVIHALATRPSGSAAA
jgi:phosphoribosylglycinamide formyltransferase-1